MDTLNQMLDAALAVTSIGKGAVIGGSVVLLTAWAATLAAANPASAAADADFDTWETL
jgi:hypothetical protein